MTVSTDVKVNRQTYIGGSDIAALMGESRFKTPYKLWCEKTGKLPIPNLDNVEAVHFGTILEDIVAKEFAERTGKEVRKAPKGYNHPDYPFMVAHIDRIVTGTDELLECKTTNTFNKDEWTDNNIPNEYILQVQWYLGITGRKIGHIACLVGGQKFIINEIKFDSDLFDLMVAQVKIFWDKVQNNIPPELTEGDNDTMKELYPDTNEELLDLSSIDKELLNDFETAIARRQELKAEIKEATSELNLVEAQLKDVIKDNIGAKTPKYKITWKKQKGQISYDKEKMIQDKVFNLYATQPEYRVLRISANKESEVA